jgi:hypothetical protein
MLRMIFFHGRGQHQHGRFGSGDDSGDLRQCCRLERTPESVDKDLGAESDTTPYECKARPGIMGSLISVGVQHLKKMNLMDLAGSH